MNPALKLLSRPLLGLLCLAAALSAWAESDVQQITHELNLKRLDVEKQIEASVNKKAANLEERKKLEDQLKALDAETAVLARDTEQALQNVQLNVDSATLEKIMLQPGNMGSCKVRKGAGVDEYVLERDDIMITFSFNTSSKTRKPVARQIKQRELHLTEIEQASFSPADIEADGQMRGKLRFEPDTFKIIHASFRGERLNDLMLGWKSSHEIQDLSCVLLDNL